MLIIIRVREVASRLQVGNPIASSFESTEEFNGTRLIVVVYITLLCLPPYTIAKGGGVGPTLKIWGSISDPKS